MRKAPCPFCKSEDHPNMRGSGCCNCEYEGRVPVGEDYHFKTADEALNHDPGVSYRDMKDNRSAGRQSNFNILP